MPYLWDARDGELATYGAENQWNEAASISGGNKFVATQGAGWMVIDVKTGLAGGSSWAQTTASMVHPDGKLWYATGEKRTKPATLQVVDALDGLLTGG